MATITKVQYNSMTDHPEQIHLIAANALQETYKSESLYRMNKKDGKVKAQFTFNAKKRNVHPLTYVFLVVGENITSSYILKPPIEDITTVSALNVDWEI